MEVIDNEDVEEFVMLEVLRSRKDDENLSKGRVQSWWDGNNFQETVPKNWLDLRNTQLALKDIIETIRKPIQDSGLIMQHLKGQKRARITSE
jgi:hypothetical protein